MRCVKKIFEGSYIAPWIINPLYENWHKVIPLGTRKSWAKKAVVHDIGQPADEIILILEGFLNILAQSPNGDQRNIGILGPGSILGEASLFCGVENRHVIRVVEPCCGVVFTKDVVFEHILNTFADLTLALFRNLAAKSYIMSTQLECSSFMSGRQKIAHFLLHLSWEQQDCSEIYRQISGLSLISISELLGMHRVTVTKEINTLKRMGILEKNNDRLVIADSNALLHILREGR